MGDLYKEYLQMWDEETGGNLIVLLSDVSAFGQYGCWGLAEYMSQPIEDAPKLRAVREVMAAEHCRSSDGKTVCNISK